MIANVFTFVIKLCAIAGPFLTFVATVSFLNTFEKKLDPLPKPVIYILIVLCFISTVGTSVIGTTTTTESNLALYN